MVLVHLLQQRAAAAAQAGGVANTCLLIALATGILFIRCNERRLLAEAGFRDIEVQPTRVYGEDDIAELTQLIATMRDAGNEVSQYVDVDVRFHLAIADAAHNDVLAGVLRSLQSLLRVWAHRVIDAAGETSSSLAMHEPVLEAIIQGDEEAARTSMSALQDRASRRLHDIIDRRDD